MKVSAVVLVAVVFALFHVACGRVSPLEQEMQRNATFRKLLCQELPNGFPGLSCDNEDKSSNVASEFIARHGLPQVESLNPVILFPGLAGSGLNAEIDKNYKKSWECFKNWSWWGIWVNLYEGLAQTCWFDNLITNYNMSTHSYANNPGVQIRPRDFGGLAGVDKLDHFDDPLDLTAYYLPIIRALEKIGYTAGRTLFGAPYDWRLSVDVLMSSDILGTNQTYEQDLLDLIEHAYNVSGQRQVHLVTHSMGGPTVLYFLNRRSLEWKTKYVASFIPIAGPFAGAFKALRAMISGENMGLEIPILKFSLLSLQKVATVFRSSGGSGYLSPDGDYYNDQVFVTLRNPARNYTANDLGRMFMDMGLPGTSDIINRTKDLISDLHHPQVNSYCLYGYGLATEIHATYDHFSSNPEEVTQPSHVDYSDLGDGTVPLFSLIECKNWIKKEHTTHQVNCKEYDLKGHTAILKDEEVHLDLLEIVTGKTNITGCPDSPQYLAALNEVRRRQK